MGGLLDDLTRTALAREPIPREAALRVLAGDDELLDVVSAGSRVRRAFFGHRVKLNTIINLKSGLCPEDCGYCSQRLGSEAEILTYSWVDPHDAAGIADSAVRAGAKRVCLVTSGRGPGERDVARIERTIEAIKADQPEVEVCVCLGLLSDGQADRLRAAGAHAYSHNLNTSEARYGEICSTHTFADRVDTLRRPRRRPLPLLRGDLRDGGVG